MNTLAARLDAAINVAAPGAIYGVAIGRSDDRSTWRIDFTEDASDAEKEAAVAALQAFDANEPEPAPASAAEKIAAFVAANPDVRAALGL